MRQSLKISELKPGDVLLYSGSSWISRAIEKFEHSPWSHASLVFDIYGEILTSEAEQQGLMANDVPTSIKGCKMIVLRPKFNINPQETSQFIAVNLGKHRYGFFRLIIAQAIWQVFHIWILNDDTSEPLKRVICGEWVAYAFFKIYQIEEFKLWYKATPASLFESDLFDHYDLNVTV